MIIFLSFLQSKHQYPIPAYSFWEYYIKKGIEEAGHSWIECEEADWALGLVPQDPDAFSEWRSSAWEKTVSYLKKNPADIFLSYLFPKQVDQHAIKEIRKSGIPCINFFCDNVREFNNIPEEFSCFDLNWVPEHKAIAMYSNARYPYIHLPMPMWVEYVNRTPSKTENTSISFIGSHDIQRQLLFEDVLKKLPDIPLSVYGAGWIESKNNIQNNHTPLNSAKKIIEQMRFIKRLGIIAYIRKLQQRNNSYIFSDDLKTHLFGKPEFGSYNSIIRESMITLGISRYSDFRYPFKNPDSYSRLRDIEAPMLGTCYLTEWTEGIDELYDINQEIAVYRNSTELIEQYKKLKESSQLRASFRLKSQLKALNEHSIPVSIEKIRQALFK